MFDAIDITKPVVADVETYGTDPKNGKLLGVAICPIDGSNSSYIALQWYDFATSTWHLHPDHKLILGYLRALFGVCQLVGHNYSYDKAWLDHTLGINTTWHACTRLMWHIASAPSGPRPYGLKDAQVEVLGWEKRGSDELEEQVKARGGSLDKGDHYLASVDVMAKYAKLDALSTAQLYNKLKPFYDKHDYWWMLEKMTRYSWLLHRNTEAGIAVDEKALESQIQLLSDTKEAYTAQFMELAETGINRLERMWRDHRAAQYVNQEARQQFLANWTKQKHFKVSSDPNKWELFYDTYKLPVVMETKKGKKGSTAAEALRVSIRESGRMDELGELLEAYENAENAEAMLSGFAKPWLGSITGGRLHPRFNPCGTVTYRLSGFKPYLLNVPASELELMACLGCDPGWVGLYGDFAAAEPCVTAHFSQDPSLLKIFKEGVGDVYLDLALVLFPQDTELKDGYNPNIPITELVKSRFKRQRGIAKTIHLAVQYTGTEYTVRKNLRVAGVLVSLEEARDLVRRYWVHFRRVAVMNEAFHRQFEKHGLVRNAVGRIIRVPTHIDIKKRDGSVWHKELPRNKDLPNRIIQSSAHDLLSFWVFNIAQLIEERGIEAKPVIVDWHDATAWQCPESQIEALELVYKDALTMLNDEVRMTVPVKAEMKRFKTLAGLKGDEDGI